MATIPRKPVAAAQPGPDNWKKEIENGSDEDIKRVSTQIQEPEGVKIFGWQISAQRALPRPSKPTFFQRKNYFGLSKRTFFICLAAAVLVLLALVIGLAVGLTRGSKPKNLPLPTNHESHTGDLTYYAPGLGACGFTDSPKDSIVAVSHLVFDAVQKGSDPNQNPLCGKKIRATRYDEQVGAQRSVDLTVHDRCVGCKETDIDVTTSVFDQLADRDLGRVSVTWAWLDVDM